MRANRASIAQKTRRAHPMTHDWQSSVPPSQSVPPADPAALVAFALDALARQPEARIEDAYKWVLQATRGGEHAASSEAQARERLAHEWGSLAPATPDEPALQPLRPDGALVRVNLRPCKARGGSMDALLQGFLVSAACVRADSADFLATWQALGVRLADGSVGHLTRGEWTRLDSALRAAGYPAIHHSAPYRAAYAPAYRVLMGGR
jgi:hypothetical protein